MHVCLIGLLPGLPPNSDSMLDDEEQQKNIYNTNEIR
jgi:hypothetical protein